jgi:drug/metabolite transporter (DMT)-like permease
MGVIIMCLIAIPITQVRLTSPMDFSLTHWLVMTLIAIMLIAATLLVQYGVTKIEATRASVLFLFELVVAAIASYYLANEHMSFHEWIGGMLIVLAAIFAALNNKQQV